MTALVFLTQCNMLSQMFIPYCVGLAASMGAFSPFMVQEPKEKRSSLTTFQNNDSPTTWRTRGQASDIRIQADEILFINEKLNKELSEQANPLKEHEDIDRFAWSLKLYEYE